MVRTKKQSQAFISTETPDMGVDKCIKCELAMNRPGEKRPGICCKQCGKEHCNKCAGLPIELCEMMRGVDKGLFTCSECESKGADMKAVLELMHSIKTELGTIKSGQAEQQAERKQVLEGLEVVKEVAKRMERIEDVQEKQGQQLSKHEDAIKKNAHKTEEGEGRMKKLEEQVEKIGQSMSNENVKIRQTNAVVKEIRDIESKLRNLVLCNIPDSTSDNPEERKKEDENRLAEILKELKIDRIKPKNVIRVGRNAHYPRKMLVVFHTVEDCEKIWESGQSTELVNGVFITRDRTFNQRQEARLFRIEREKEEREEVTAPGAKPQGRPRGRPRGGVRGGRGGGGRNLLTLEDRQQRKGNPAYLRSGNRLDNERRSQRLPKIKNKMSERRQN